jgi:hypothetical protein
VDGEGGRTIGPAVGRGRRVRTGLVRLMWHARPRGEAGRDPALFPAVVGPAAQDAWSCLERKSMIMAWTLAPFGPVSRSVPWASPGRTSRRRDDAMVAALKSCGVASAGHTGRPWRR